MIEVAALTSGKNIPSTLFRVQQHIPLLRSLGVDVTEFQPLINKYYPIPYWPKNIKERYIFPVSIAWQGVKLSMRMPGLVGSWRSQVTWVERSVLPGYLTLEPLLKRPFVFDMDDAIWLVRPFGEKAIRHIVKRAACVIVGNNYLAEWVSQYTDHIEIIPTAIDTLEFAPATSQDRTQQFIVGWLGTSGNLTYLQAIEDSLREFFSVAPYARLLIVSSEPPVFKNIDPSRVIFVKWQRETAAHYVSQMDVGIMPLPDTAWTRGKCSFKMLQYMATGLPVVVSPVGMNQEVLNMGQVGLAASSHKEWLDGLMTFYQQREMGSIYGENGRRIVELHFSQSVIAQKLAQTFKSLRLE